MTTLAVLRAYPQGSVFRVSLMVPRGAHAVPVTDQGKCLTHALVSPPAGSQPGVLTPDGACGTICGAWIQTGVVCARQVPKPTYNSLAPSRRNFNN